VAEKRKEKRGIWAVKNVGKIFFLIKNFSLKPKNLWPKTHFG